jgi:citrate/tricarballylate utilization protein
MFGALGGLGMVVGVTGLISLKLKSDRKPAEPRTLSLDYSFLVILGLTAFSGLVMLVLRNTRAMGTVLTVHLGLVAALFLTIPYGKFVHALYRFVALVLLRAQDPAKTNHP